MFSGFHKTRVNSGVEKTTAEGRRADHSTMTGRLARSPPSRQYQPNNDPSLYLYGNSPSTLKPYVSSIGDWNDTNNTQQHFQYGNPEIMPSSNSPNPGPYYLSNPSPYAMADIGSSRITSGSQSHTAKPELVPLQDYGVPDPVTDTNNPRSNDIGNRTGGELATRSSYTSRTGHGAYDEYYPSTDQDSTKSLVKHDLDVEDKVVTISRTTKTGGRNLSESASRTASRTASRSAFRSASQNNSTSVTEQGVLGDAQQNPIEDNDEIVRHDQGRGEVRWDNGMMLWRELKFINMEEHWQPAVYHHQIRRDLIAAADAQGTYDFPRDIGVANSDVTCFLFAQKSWGMERANRPEILFQWEKADHKDPTYNVPDWYHDGKLVLDPENRPVRKFRNIPDTCSSMLEGGIMEAIKREDSRVTHQDFVARMLPQILIKTSKGPKSQALYGKNAMAARMRRFREEAGCIVWGIRAGSDTIRRYMMGIIPAQYIQDNNTKGFRDLYPHEIMGIRQQNEGKFAERAGHRAIDDDVRKRRSLKMRVKFERRKEKFDKGLKPKNKATETKQKRTATKDTLTEDEGEVPDSAAGTRVSAPRRREERADTSITPGGSTKRKSSETDWNEDSYELGDDGDDEGRQLCDEGCSNLNANPQWHHVKRPKLTDTSVRYYSIPEAAHSQNIEHSSGYAAQSWTSAVPFADATRTNFQGIQDSDGQGLHDAEKEHLGLYSVDGTTILDNSAANAVSDPFEDDLFNGSGSMEEIFTFYAGLGSELVASSNVAPSNAALELDKSIGSTFEEDAFNFFDKVFGEQAAASNVEQLDAALKHNEVVGSTFAEESSHFCNAVSGELATAFNDTLSNAASASNDLVDFDEFLANYPALADTNLPSIEWGTSLDKFFQDNVADEEVRQDKGLPSEVFLPPYEGGDRNSPL